MGSQIREAVSPRSYSERLGRCQEAVSNSLFVEVACEFVYELF